MSLFKEGDYVVFKDDYSETLELADTIARIDSIISLTSGIYYYYKLCNVKHNTKFVNTKFFEGAFDIDKSKQLNDFCDKIKMGDYLFISEKASNTRFSYTENTLKQLALKANNPVQVVNIIGNNRLFIVEGIDAFLTIDVFIPDVIISPKYGDNNDFIGYCLNDITATKATIEELNKINKEEKKMGKARYKVGDLVRIKKDLKGDTYCGSEYVAEQMASHKGKLATITYVGTAKNIAGVQYFYYHIDLDNYSWTEEMFENTVEPIYNGIVTDNVGHAYKYDKNGIAHKYTKEEKKMGVDFKTVNSERYVSYGKHNGATIPQTTTEVTLPNGKKGYATVDTDNYDEREGILNAIANAIYDGNFDKVYDATKKAEAKVDKENRTCNYCGTIYDTVEEKEECVKEHIQRKKDKKEAYAIRKEARRRLEEAIREDRIEAVMQELLAEYETVEDVENNEDTINEGK